MAYHEFLGTSPEVMTEMLFSEEIATDKRRNRQLSGGAAMEIAFFDFFEDNPTRTKI